MIVVGGFAGIAAAHACGMPRSCLPTVATTPTFAESVSRKVTRRLEKLGVKVLTGVRVETVDDKGVIAGGKRIPSAAVRDEA